MLDIEKLVESEDLYVTSLPQGGSFCWRSLTLKEFKVFSGLMRSQTINEYVIYEMIFERCYQGKAFLIDGNLPAGVTISIGQFILHVSGNAGAEQEKEDLESYRAAYPKDTLIEYMKRILLRAFPTYTPETLKNWSRERLFREFVIAEAVLQEGVGYTPIDMKNILSQEDIKKQRKKKSSTDFDKENNQLNQALGTQDGKHLTEMSIDDLAKRVRLAKKAGG